MDEQKYQEYRRTRLKYEAKEREQKEWEERFQLEHRLENLKKEQKWLDEWTDKLHLEHINHFDYCYYLPYNYCYFEEKVIHVMNQCHWLDDLYAVYSSAKTLMQSHVRISNHLSKNIKRIQQPKPEVRIDLW